MSVCNPHGEGMHAASSDRHKHTGITAAIAAQCGKCTERYTPLGFIHGSIGRLVAVSSRPVAVHYLTGRGFNFGFVDAAGLARMHPL